LASNLKILAVRFSSLGDIVLTVPLLRKLREKNPGAVIDYLTKQRYSQFLKELNYIDNVIEARDDINFRELKRLKSVISENKYDVIYDLHNNLKTLYLKIFQKSLIRTFRKYSLRKYIYVNLKINLLKNILPVYKRYLQTGNFYNGFTTEKFTVNGHNILSEYNIPDEKTIICIAPVSRHFTKTYPAEYYSRFIEMFDADKYAFVIVGTADQKNSAEALNSTNVINLCGKTDLRELMGIIQKSSLMISGDTGPMHIAEMLGIPLIMLAGSSVREFGFYPQSADAVVIEVSNLPCRPCSHIGRNFCPKNHFRCMKDISPEMIYEKTVKMLKIFNSPN
jgi:heptosyltransferase-2